MTKHITIIQGHPDPDGNHFGNALAEAYRHGANESGHAVDVIDVAQLDCPWLRKQDEWENAIPAADIRDAQKKIAVPSGFRLSALARGYSRFAQGILEQTMRPGFAIQAVEDGVGWRKLLARKSARIVVTMGMPALVDRWYFRAHSLKSFERNIFCGIGPIRESLIGVVASKNVARRTNWLKQMRTLGNKVE